MTVSVPAIYYILAIVCRNDNLTIMVAIKTVRSLPSKGAEAASVVEIRIGKDVEATTITPCVAAKT